MKTIQLTDEQVDLLIDAVYVAWDKWDQMDALGDIQVMRLLYFIGAVTIEELDEFRQERLKDEGDE